MTKKRRWWMWILLAVVGLVILGAITGGDDKGPDKTAVKRNAPARVAAEQRTTATTDEPVQTIDDARQAVDDDHYADAATIATAIDASAAASIRRRIANRLARRASVALRVGDHSGAKALLIEANDYPTTTQERQARASYKAATARAAQRRQQRRIAAAQRRRAMAAAATAAAQPKPPSNCDPNYEGACLDPSSSDYDCSGGSGDGPGYSGPVRRVASDPFDLDRDGDGLACEN